MTTAGKTVPTSREARRARAWRCCGANGCGEILRGSWAAAERHADDHGGARLEVVQ